jgi:hypothetical protein
MYDEEELKKQKGSTAIFYEKFSLSCDDGYLHRVPDTSRKVIFEA